MKHPKDFLTMDLVGSKGVSQLTRGVAVLVFIKHTKVASADVIRSQVLPGMSKRSVQRYLTNLEGIGLVRRIGYVNTGYRYYLSGMAKELFEVKA
ncbi:hypothetical protein [Acinetobacter towneri]|uniref:hypothetical protein n=1 Tax=Acinetobacter towneri TaxID=202956 RepID=UPI003A8A9F8C